MRVVFTLNAEKVCLLRAMQLFAVREPYPHVDLLRDWAAAVPAGMEPTIAMLRGYALCESSATLEALARSASGALHSKSASTADATRVWRYWPVASLSPHVKTRFTQLFAMKARWTLSDITPYTEDLCAPGQTLEQLLLAHTRAVMAELNGVRQVLYTKR